MCLRLQPRCCHRCCQGYTAAVGGPRRTHGLREDTHRSPRAQPGLPRTCDSTSGTGKEREFSLCGRPGDLSKSQVLSAFAVVGTSVLWPIMHCNCCKIVLIHALTMASMSESFCVRSAAYSGWRGGSIPAIGLGAAGRHCTRVSRTVCGRPAVCVRAARGGRSSAVGHRSTSACCCRRRNAIHRCPCKCTGATKVPCTKPLVTLHVHLTASCPSACCSS